MRYLLMFSAFILVASVALRFAGEPTSKPAFEGRRIILITEGRQNDPFIGAVREGAQRAMNDLGCDAYAYPSNGDAAEEVNLFQREMAGAPDGICIIGNVDNTDITTHIEDALDAEITVTTYYRPLPVLEQSHRFQGFGFAGPDFERAGNALIEAAVLKHNLVAGGRVLVVADESRMKQNGLLEGCRRAMAKHGLQEDLLVLGTEGNYAVGSALEQRFSDAPETPPALVCLLSGPLEESVAIMRNAGFEPGEIPLVGVGIVDETSGLLPQDNTSYVSILLSEDIATQTYLAILQICMAKTYGANGTHIVTPFRLYGAPDPTELAQTEQSQPFVQIY